MKKLFRNTYMYRDIIHKLQDIVASTDHRKQIEDTQHVSHQCMLQVRSLQFLTCHYFMKFCFCFVKHVNSIHMKQQQLDIQHTFVIENLNSLNLKFEK